MKKTNLRTLLLTAAVSGVLAGIAAPVQASTTSGTPVLLAQNQPADKNSCKGKNSCNGKQDQQTTDRQDRQEGLTAHRQGQELLQRQERLRRFGTESLTSCCEGRGRPSCLFKGSKDGGKSL